MDIKLLTDTAYHPKSKRDECEHGYLRRTCEICDRDEEIARLRAERDEARADTARLDWLQSEVEQLELRDWSSDVGDGRAWSIDDDEYQTDNLRDAIDAARESGGEGAL